MPCYGSADDFFHRNFHWFCPTLWYRLICFLMCLRRVGSDSCHRPDCWRAHADQSAEASAVVGACEKKLPSPAESAYDPPRYRDCDCLTSYAVSKFDSESFTTQQAESWPLAPACRIELSVIATSVASRHTHVDGCPAQKCFPLEIDFASE